MTTKTLSLSEKQQGDLSGLLEIYHYCEQDAKRMPKMAIRLLRLAYPNSANCQIMEAEEDYVAYGLNYLTEDRRELLKQFARDGSIVVPEPEVGVLAPEGETWIAATSKQARSFLDAIKADKAKSTPTTMGAITKAVLDCGETFFEGGRHDGFDCLSTIRLHEVLVHEFSVDERKGGRTPRPELIAKLAPLARLSSTEALAELELEAQGGWWTEPARPRVG